MFRSSNTRTKWDQQLEKWGRQFVLMRTDLHFRCPAWKPDNPSTCDGTCVYCMGLGYIYGYELHTMYKSTMSTLAIDRPSFGWYEFYLKSDIEVKESDAIVEVEFDSLGRINRVIAEYDIKDVVLYYFQSDKAYRKCTAVKKEINTPYKLLRLLQDMATL
jgi:hypothetical protein